MKIVGRRLILKPDGDDTRDLDEEIGLPTGIPRKTQTRMRALKKEKGESVIPHGIYCYDEKGHCPYLDTINGKPGQMNGYCWFLEVGDWEESGGGLLWDQCKSCNINDNLGFEEK